MDSREAPGPAATASMENNLDSLLVGTLRQQAEKRGVRYAETGTLEIQARYTGTSSGIKEERKVALRTLEAWRKLWSEHVSRHGDSKPELPKVDLKANMVLAVFLGQRPTGGYAIRIEEVRKTDKGLLVRYKVTKPPAGAIVTQALTQPYDMVVVPSVEGDVVFEATG